MLIYVLRWRPSWISDRHKKHIFCRGPSNDHSLVSEKIFEISANHSILLALAAMLNIRLERKTETLKFSNAFFSETTNMIKAKLYMNVHWMVLYNLKVFLFRYEIQNGGYGRT
jgi:hypothetical protein